MTIGLKADAGGTSGTIQIGGVDQVTVTNAGGLTATTIAGTTVTQGGVAMPRMVLATNVTASGTAIDFTGIPSWAKRITIIFNGLSLNSTSHLLVQIGSGSFVTSSYVGSSGEVSTSAPNQCNGITSSAGFPVYIGVAASNAWGTMVLNLITSNAWLSSHSVGKSTAAASGGGGSSALSGALDRVRITTVSGTDTFDAGSVNIMYEG